MATEPGVVFEVEPQTADRNRLTVAFRLILAIPHILLVGGPGLGIGVGSDRTGVLGAVAGVCAIINWFAIVFTSKPIEGLMSLQLMYLKWRANALAYEALLRDEYPPFGEGDYPVTSSFPQKLTDRNRWTVGFRLILVIPHLLVLAVLLFAWFVTAVVGWFSLLITGSYPEGLARFAVGVMRWSLRVETYILLLDDPYPPFSLAP
jgi:hypothetical protein